MKLFGQLDLKVILVPLATAALGSGGTFVATRGSAAMAYEQRQTAQQVAIDRLVTRDLAREAEYHQLRVEQESMRNEQVSLRRETKESFGRIEAMVDGLRDGLGLPKVKHY